MNPRIVCTGLLWLAACQPPPEIEVGEAGATDPAVRIAYPPQLNEDGDGPFQLNRGEFTGDWETLLVIDVDNFDLVDPYDPATVENVEGEGHWHVIANGVETPIPGLASATVVIPAADGADGQLVTITAALKRNDHSPQTDSNGDPVTATVEVQLAEAL